MTLDPGLRKEDTGGWGIFLDCTGEERHRLGGWGRERDDNVKIRMGWPFLVNISILYILLHLHVRDHKIHMQTISTRSSWTVGDLNMSKLERRGWILRGITSKSRCSLCDDTPISRMKFGILSDSPVASWPSRISEFLSVIWIPIRVSFLFFFSL